MRSEEDLQAANAQKIQNSSGKQMKSYKDKKGVFFSKHAYEQFKKTSTILGLNPSPKIMEAIFAKATPEQSKCQTTRFNLLKRNLTIGKTKYYVANGWRFVVAGNKVVTVERVKPHENYKYMKNFISRSEGVNANCC